MSEHLRTALRRASSAPSRTPDPNAEWRRARRGQRLRAAALAGGLAVTTLVAVPWAAQELSDVAVPEVVAPPTLDTPLRQPSGPPVTDLPLARQAIDGYGVELFVPQDWGQTSREPTTWSGRQGSLTVFIESTPWSHSERAGVWAHCEERAAGDEWLAGHPVEELSVAGQSSCLVTSADGRRFVGVVRFPPAPNAMSTATDLVLTGAGVDGRAVLESVRFLLEAGEEVESPPESG